MMPEEKAKSEEEIYREIHKKKIKNGQAESGKKGGRPRKEIDVEEVKRRFEQDIPLYEIAAQKKMSYNTLRRRLNEKGIILEKELKKGGNKEE